MWIKVVRSVVMVAVVAAVVGCEAKLRDRRTVEVDPASHVVIPIDAKPEGRTLKVTAKSDGAPIEVYVYLAKDDKQAEQDIFAKRSDLFLAHDVNVEEANLTAEIPANEEAMVVLACANTQRATVELSIDD